MRNSHKKFSLGILYFIEDRKAKSLELQFEIESQTHHHTHQKEAYSFIRIFTL